jgi:hypothetical protein
MSCHQLSERERDALVAALSATGGLAFTSVPRHPGSGLELGETFELFVQSASGRTAQGYWHQLYVDGVPDAFARSSPGENGSITFDAIGRAPLSKAIDEGISWIDEHVHGDPVVRLLAIPSSYAYCLWLESDTENRILPIADPHGRLGLAAGQLHPLSVLDRE